MRTEQFEYLVDIYKTKSITKTAEKFYISRQVVSHAMRSLEDEIGVPLFIRQHNNLEFTAIGEIAAQKAEAIVAAYQDFLVTVADFSVDTDCLDLEKTITIWTIPRLASSLIPVVTMRYKKIYPEVEIRIVSMSSQNILKKLPDSDATIGVISYPDNVHSSMEPFKLAQYSNLTVYPFIKSQFYICMHKNSKYNIKSCITDDDLVKLPILSYAPSFEQLGVPLDVPFNTTSIINDLQALCALIRQDAGVGLITLNEYNFLVNTKNLVLKPLCTKTNRNIYFGYVLNDRGMKNPYMKSLSQLLEEINV